MPSKLRNNVSTTLQASIASGDLTMTVPTGKGALWDDCASPDYGYTTLMDTAGTTFEIVKVTARSGDSLTIARAQDGTAAAGWAAGSIVERRLNSLAIKESKVDSATSADSAAFSGNAASVTNGVYLNAANNFTVGANLVTVVNSSSPISTIGGGAGFEAKGNGTGPAVIAFHRPSNFAAYLGIDTDNQWKVGGWSMGSVAYNIIHSGNIGSGLTFSGGVLSAPSSTTWCVFNGSTAGNNAPISGNNIASINRTGAGQYTVTFASAMPDANYAVLTSINTVASNNVTNSFCQVYTTSTGSFQLVCATAGGSLIDISRISIFVQR